jgi:hypothetical protein
LNQTDSIFISYREEDSAYARRLADALKDRYGDERVFIDTDLLKPDSPRTTSIFENFETNADRQITLVLIGTDWIYGRNDRGLSRLNDPRDGVRMRIETALLSSYPITSVLIRGAYMPLFEELPPPLGALRMYQAIVLNDGSWQSDVEVLCQKMENILPGLRDSVEPLPSTARLVFVSHANEDRDLIEKIVNKLEGGGIQCWVSYRDIPAGEGSWSRSIVTAIARSQLMVVVLTERSVNSKQVEREISIADEGNIAFIPVHLDKAPLPEGLKYFFSMAQRLD